VWAKEATYEIGRFQIHPESGTFRGGHEPGNLCTMDLSRLGACSCLQQDATNTVKQWASAVDAMKDGMCSSKVAFSKITLETCYIRQVNGVNWRDIK